MTGPAGTPAGTPAGRPAGTAAGARTPRDTGGPRVTDPAAGEPDEAGTDPEVVRPGRSRRRLLLAAAAGLLLLVLLGVVLALLARPDEAETRQSAVLAATRYTTSLTTYDARTLDDDVARVRRVSTDEFAGEYAESIEDLREQITAEQRTSAGEVVGAGLEELDGDTATVLLAVDQRITAAGQPARTEATRVRVELVRRDGTWLLRSVSRV